MSQGSRARVAGRAAWGALGLALVVGGCSGGGGTPSFMAAGGHVPADCSAADYASGEDGIARPECYYMRTVVDFSQPDVVLSYIYFEARAEPFFVTDLYMEDGVDTPEEYVEAYNSDMRDSWAEYSSEELPGTGIRLSDVLAEKDLEWTLVDGEVRGLLYIDPLSLDVWLENEGLTLVDGLVTYDDWIDTSFFGDSDVVIVFDGPPTETNGKVDGNMVFWRVTSETGAVQARVTGPVG